MTLTVQIRDSEALTSCLPFYPYPMPSDMPDTPTLDRQPHMPTPVFPKHRQALKESFSLGLHITFTSTAVHCRDVPLTRHPLAICL